MKTTKKFLAIFLAMAVLLAVCSLSVFAIGEGVWSTNDNGGRYDDYSTNIDGEGWARIYPDGRTLEFKTFCTYVMGPEQNYTLYAQCAVIYTDGSSDCYYVYDQRYMHSTHTEYIGDMITVTSDKEIEMFNLEFQIHANGVLYWEGYLDIPYTN